MGLKDRLGFNEAFDATAQWTRRRTLERVALLASVFALSTPLLGATKSVTWWFLALAAELWLWLSTGPRLMARAPIAARLSRLLASFASSAMWAMIGSLFWFSHEPMSELLAVALLAGVLIYVVHACHRSPIHILSSFVPPAVLLGLLPFSYDYDLVRMAAMEGAFLILVGFAGLSAFSACRSHRELTAAAKALEERSEAADAANRAKSDFLANMSHEIRTPLNGVLGMAQAMAAEDLPPAQLERLSLIRQSGEALLALLNDLLDLSKIEAGKIELEDGAVDIDEVATAVRAAFATPAESKGVALALTIAPDASGLWRGDVTRVRQILYNLVSNAVKFTAEGRVEIEVRRDDAGLVIAVVDTGPGIPAERLPSLFSKFVQVDASTTRKFGGTGLGLAICRELAQQMGGDVAVESVLGQGSSFEARLPLPFLGTREEEAAIDEAAAPAEPRQALRVLAAEDNPMNQLVLKTLMAQVGVEPQMAENGLRAIEAWETGDWDVILMDVQMPEMDGPSAARCIRRREAETGRRRTPIIALTANAMAHQAAEYAAAGMDVIVPKPLEFARLLEAIDQVLTEPEAEVLEAAG